MGERLRLFESALNDVRYVYGRPLRYNAELVRRLCSDDPETREQADAEARMRVAHD